MSSKINFINKFNFLIYVGNTNWNIGLGTGMYIDDFPFNELPPQSFIGFRM
jgi:hypothetical protein